MSLFDIIRLGINEKFQQDLDITTTIIIDCSYDHMLHDILPPGQIAWKTLIWAFIVAFNSYKTDDEQEDIIITYLVQSS